MTGRQTLACCAAALVFCSVAWAKRPGIGIDPAITGEVSRTVLSGATGVVGVVGLSLPGAASNLADRASVSTDAPQSPLRWYDELRPALLDAAMNYRPVFLLFTGPDCPWCMRLRNEVLGDPEVEVFLRKVTLVEMDVERDRMEAMRFGVRGVPTMLILSSDSVVRDGISGYAPKRVVLEMLGRALGQSVVVKEDKDLQAAVALLESGTIPDDKWPSLMLAAGMPGGRKVVKERILTIANGNRQALVRLLEHPRLAVRLGALDLLEELSGETFGYEPWQDAAADNAAAIAKWNEWAAAATNQAATAFTALTKEAFDGYVQDLIADRGDPDRAVRARRMLILGGRSTVEWLAAFIAAHPELPVGMRRRTQEVQYAILLPSIGGKDPALVAHRLVSGNLDVRLKTIRELPRIGRSAMPILQELMDDPDPLVREAVVEAALKAGRDSAVGMMERVVAKERDRDVLFVMIRELRRVSSSKGLALLGSYLRHPDEDLAIAAFSTLAKMESKRSIADVKVGLKDSRWRVRVAALQSVQAIKSPELVPDVEALLEDKDDFVRFSAVQTLAAMKGKQTAKKLEAVFLRDDNLKGPIIAAFGAMDMPLPDSFRKALQGKPVPLLVSVAGNLRRCGARGLPIAAALATHEDNDVACAALALIAENGHNDSHYRAMLAEALGTRDRERILTVLRGLRRGDSDSYRYSSFDAPVDVDELENIVESSGGDFGAVGTIINAFFGAPKPAANAEPSTNGIPSAEDVFNAFMGGAPAAPAKAPVKPPAPTMPTNTAPSADDVFRAFMGDQAPAAAANVVPDAPQVVSLVEAIRARLKDSDAEIRFAASCALLARGDMSVVPEISAGFADRPEDERKQLAYALRAAVGRAETLPFFVKMLGDPSAEVRTAAVGALLETKKPDRMEALFKELMRPESRLKPTEVYTYELRSEAGATASRKVREWALKMLQAEDGPQWRVPMGIVLLQQAWQRGDEARIEPYLKSRNPLERRAAWYALGKKDLRAFKERMDIPAGDSSDLVRMVVPTVFRTSSARWVQYFTEDAFEEDWSWESSYGGYRRRAEDSVIKTLRKLETDVSSRVRFEAMLALLDQGEDVPMDRIVRTLDGFADVERASAMLQQTLQRDGEGIKPEDAQLLLAALDRGDLRDESLSWLRKKIKVEDGGVSDDPPSFTARHAAPVTASTSGVVAVEAPAGATPVRLIYFVKKGCSECAEVNRILDNLRKDFPLLRVDEHDIEKSDGKRYNEALCKRFDVPDVRRLVAPAIFATAGALVKEDCTYGRLGELIQRSSVMTDTGWAEVRADELAKADTGIKDRWKGMTLAVVIGSALSDGVNPCAFATIIFLLSYLQVVRRKPRQILVIGMAFVFGVFLAYYGLGLGLAEIVKQNEIVQKAGRWLNVVMAVLVGVLAVLNVRDGILCARGRMGEMLLQLPGGLKAAIHRVIRYQVRQTWMVLAAFIAGLVVSVLEMACTGQVYLPTIYYILQQEPTETRANAYLLIYNLAFIVPLLVVFGLAYSGVRSERVALWLEKHAAAVKFATAALFMVMLVLLVKQM